MKLFEKLHAEYITAPRGERCPEYFRFLGYREHLSEPIDLLRAYGIEALFTRTKPHILVHDLIAGNVRGLYIEEDEIVIKHAKKLVSKIGGRDFGTNSDHFTPDYGHLMEVGITGLFQEIEQSLKKHAEDDAKVTFLKAMQITLSAFCGMIENYKKEAERLKGNMQYKEGSLGENVQCNAGQLNDNEQYDAERLNFIIANCQAILDGPPQTFAQGLQLMWFCHIAFLLEGRYAMAIGRIDQYLWKLYKKDIETGVLTKDRAIELLENTFTKIVNNVVNICIGGMDKTGNCQVNELSYCVLFAVKNCNTPGPNLSARITPNVPDEFLLECLKSIGTGLGYPALMNDRVNIEALKKYGYEEDDIYEYSMVGCIENFISGMQPPWSDGRFDPPRFFDYIFNNGICRMNGSTGIDMGDVENIRSMQEFMEAFEIQLKQGAAEYMANFQAKNMSVNPAYYSEPFLSLFCKDCIGRGLDINNGGSKYPSVHGVALMGVGTVADSLAAIEQTVFVDKTTTLSELKEALNNNFEGYEELREMLLAAPKYGNNDDFVDKYAVWFLDYLSAVFAEYRTRDGGGIYVAMAANISNIHAGATISATPDGRKAGEPLSDAASPTYGRDTKGATVTLNSVAKPDYTKVACGSVINQKFSPSMFSGEKLNKLAALIRTYFKKGGQEIQINATSREVLMDAMEHPENYQSLVVRVSGFSEYYVRLDRAVQLDILNRTQHE